jgi:acyl-coenzyme A synthetase/AMP-(fatty) acid ligase
MDDVIKSRGEKVAPKEVETVLANIPGVKECAVIGVDDPVLGQAVKAFVVLEQGAVLGVKELQHRCQDKLENFMVPKYVELVDSLPRTDTGKIKKKGLA